MRARTHERESEREEQRDRGHTYTKHSEGVVRGFWPRSTQKAKDRYVRGGGGGVVKEGGREGRREKKKEGGRGHT